MASSLAGIAFSGIDVIIEVAQNGDSFLSVRLADHMLHKVCQKLAW